MASLMNTRKKGQLRKWISENKQVKFELLYKATRDGYSNTSFHKFCDNKGPTVTLVKNNTGYLFGGYTSVNWTSSTGNSFSIDPNAFLFTLENQEGNVAIKWNVKSGGGNAIYNHTNYGPTFGGGHDVHLITAAPAKNGDYWQATGVSWGYTYDTNGKTNADFCGDNLQIVELEVYSVTETSLLEDGHEWRKVEGWTDKIRAQLIQEVARYKPFEAVGVPECRVLMLGQVGAGKSSFFNTVNSVFRGYVTAQAGSGSAQHSLTTAFRAYNIRSSQGGKPLCFRLCDTMGLEENQGLNAADVGYILDGHVPDRFQFNPVVRISPESPGFVEKSTLDARVHCVAIVMDANTSDVISPKMLERLLAIKEVINQRGVPMVVLMTKIDQVCEDTSHDASLVFKSEAVLDALSELAAKMGLPRNHVLPVKNYESETDLVIPVDILVLTALRQTLRFADGYFDEQYDRLASQGQVFEVKPEKISRQNKF